MIVVKIGGSKGSTSTAICATSAALVQQGQKMILVHGGSAETNEISEQLGHPPRFVTSAPGLPAATPTGLPWRSSPWSPAARSTR